MNSKDKNILDLDHSPSLPIELVQLEEVKPTKPQVPSVKEDTGPVKLFVGHIPTNFHEIDIKPMFYEYGPCQVQVLFDKITNQHKGCAFVTFNDKEHAELAIKALDESTTLIGAKYPMQVRRAGQKPLKKLLISNIPKETTEEQLTAVFEPFGFIESLFIMKNSEGNSRGMAYCKYSSSYDAEQAISALDKIYKMPNSSVPLSVKYADQQRLEREHREKSETERFKSKDKSADFSRPFFPTPFPLYPPHMLNRPQFIPQPYMYPIIPNPSYPLYPQPTSPYDFYPPHPQYYPPPIPNHGSREGPEGANLFIHGIPTNYCDADLSRLFESFGRIISAKVFMDRDSNLNKGYGFLSFDDPNAAIVAIQQMNGFYIAGKRIKVQFKRGTKRINAPY